MAPFCFSGLNGHSSLKLSGLTGLGHVCRVPPPENLGLCNERRRFTLSMSKFVFNA